ncbi:predicted protein [Postia placenta Mad-698-R]|nr:predicted protein [Postia placenta Mad-698-R]
MLSKADRLMENIYISKLARYYIEEDAGWKGKTPHFSSSRPRYLPSYIHWPPERLDCRLKESCPDNRTRDGRFLPRGHMLFLGAYHIAARQLEDDHYGKDTWNAASAGSVTAKYLQAFERRVSRHFRYQVNFSKEAVIDFVFALWLKYGNTVLTETRLAVAEAAQRQRNKVARQASQNAAKAMSVHPQGHLCPLVVERVAPQSLADSVAPLVPVAQGLATRRYPLRIMVPWHGLRAIRLRDAVLYQCRMVVQPCTHLIPWQNGTRTAFINMCNAQNQHMYDRHHMSMATPSDSIRI